MFQVELTNYGQTLISSQVIFDGIILLYDYIEEISSLSDISSYTVNLDEEACGNLNKNVGNVRIRDLSISEYQSKTILFYVNDNNEKKFVAGYSQTTPIVQKNGQPLILFLSFDFSAFTHGFLFSSIQAGMPNASHNNDGIVHIENPDIVSDDTYSVYSKPQVDDLLSKSDTELVKGTQTASVAAWTGVSKRSALFEGMQINYFLPYAGKTNSTLNLTLANNTTTGEIPIYFRGATAVGNHFPVGSLIQLTYMENVTIGSTTIAAGWFADSDYVDGNTTSYTSTANPLKAGTNGIYGRCLVMRTGADTWESIMLSYTNKLANHVLNTSGFYTDTILYNSGTSTITSGNSTTATHYPYYNNISYTNYFLDVTTTPLVVGEPVYLVGSIGNDGKFYLKTTGSYQAQEVTTSDIYLYLGLAFSTTAIGLMPNHPMFTLKNGVIVEVTTQSLTNSNRIDSLQNSIPTNTSDLTNDSGFITAADIPTGVAYFNNDAGYLTSSDLSPYALTASLSEGAFVDVDETTTTASSTNLVTGKSMAAYVSSQLPTVNNATLTIQKNGTTVNTFTANASSPVTANITVPTTVAELTDSSDYVTNNDLETTVQDYLEEHQNVIVAGNNITISSSSSLLPAEYAQVEYIQSNGASYLDTGLVPTDSTKITVDLFNNTTGSFYAVGARANSSSTILLAQSGSSTGATLLGSFNGTTITAKTGNTNWSRTDAGQRYLINIETNNGTGTYNVYDYNNDREFSGQTSYTSLGTISTHIYLLGFNSANVLGGTSKVYKCEIYQNDLLAFQGIPCYRVSDGVYGLYDTVSNTFKTSVTSTPFTGSTEIHDTLTISSKDEKAQWGKITGTLSNQTDLNTALGLKANSADLATVATSGSYNDLSNKPTIPTVNNAKLTIKKNASDTGTEFTANASTDVTCNLGLATVATSGSYNDLSNKPSIPTKVSDLTNDSGFISTETDPTVPSWAKASSKPSYTLDEVSDGTNRKLPTKVSDLTNDSGFITGYTETDPTVPSWAKQSSKPSYTLDEVTDGSTRKLSNYVPTSRKVNNKALSADITLNLDDVADGSTRKLSNYVPTTRTVNSKALSSNIVLTLDDVADGTNRSIPTDTSDLTNGAGFLTSFTETDPTVPSWAKQSSKPSYTLDEVTDGSTRKLSDYVPTSRKVNNKALSADITLNLDDVADGTNRKIPTLTSELTNDSGFLTSHQDISGKQDVLTAGEGISLENNVVKTTGIPFGICDGTSTSTAFTVTVPGIYKLEDGVCCMVKNGVVTSASGFTLNVNGLGGKPCYTNLAAATRDTTLFNVAYTMLFVYDSTRVSGGCWICYRGYDANTNTIGYQLRTNNSILTVTDRSRYYKIFFTSANNNQWIPASSDWTNDATTVKPVNQRPINPFGRIVYTSANTNYTTGSNLAAATIWDQYNLTLGYSFNVNGGALTLTVNKPVYIKCAPQSDGSAIIDAETPTVQDLPTSADNKIYILLGIATSATQVELFINHPVYYHDGNGIKLWIGTVIPTKTSDLTNDSGFITSSTIPTVNDSTITIKKNNSDTGDSFTTNAASGKIINLGLGDAADKAVDTTISAASSSTNLPTSQAVASFVENKGYISTETDPTVPSWAKQSSKPSYTLDEVTDGSTRKLSNYVPTSRKVNNKALSADITLNLDDVADGTNRKIPTNTNQLTNGAGFITSSDLPTNHVTTDTAQTITGNKTFSGTLTGTLTGNADTATTATNANKVGLLGNSSGSYYPIVFAGSVNSSTTDRANKTLYTPTAIDTIGSGASYIPSTSTFVCKNQKFNRVDYITNKEGMETVTFITEDADHTAYPAICTRFRSNNSGYGQAQFIVSPFNLKMQVLNKIASNEDIAGTWFNVKRTILDVNIDHDSTGSSFSFGCKVLPLSDGGFSLGSSDNRWNTLYAQYIGNGSNYVTSAFITTINGTTFTGNASTATTATKATNATNLSYTANSTTTEKLTATDTQVTAKDDIIPDTYNAYDLGSSSKYWKNIYAYSFIKKNGTSSQFLKADGSVDSSSYITSSDIPLTSISVDGTTQTITNKNVDLHIPEDLNTSELIGGFVRYDVSGSGNLSIRNIYGLFPYTGGTTQTLPAGSYLVRIRLRSTTSSYSLTVNFGTEYTLTTTNGVIDDVRTATLSSAQGFSATITTVAANTYIRVVIYEPDSTISSGSVGAAAITNDYNDLDNIPNGTLVIQKNGTNVASFSASENSNVTANISVPTNTNQLTNGAGFLTSSDMADYKTTARSDSKFLYNGQSVDVLMDNFGISNSTNLLNTSGVTSYVAIRANSSNPFIGLKQGSNLWYCQASNNVFYFGPTAANALKLDQSGNGRFQSGECAATQLVVQEARTNNADGNKLLTISVTSQSDTTSTTPSFTYTYHTTNFTSALEDYGSITLSDYTFETLPDDVVDAHIVLSYLSTKTDTFKFTTSSKIQITDAANTKRTSNITYNLTEIGGYNGIETNGVKIYPTATSTSTSGEQITTDITLNKDGGFGKIEWFDDGSDGNGIKIGAWNYSGAALRIYNNRHRVSILSNAVDIDYGTGLLDSMTITINGSTGNKIIPNTDGHLVLGGGTSRFKTIYTTDIGSSTVPVTNIYGALKGNAATATSATTATYSQYIKYSTNTNYPMYASSATVLRPTSNSAVDIGTSSYKYNNVFSNRFKGSPVIAFAQSTVAADTSAKTLSSKANFPSTLENGDIICIYFTNTNTISSSYISDGTNTFYLYRTHNLSVGTTVQESWPAQSYILFRIYINGTTRRAIMLQTSNYPTSTASGTTNIIPSVNSTGDTTGYDLGSTSYRWRELFAYAVNDGVSYTNRIGSNNYTTLFGLMYSLRNSGRGSFYFLYLNYTNSTTSEQSLTRGQTLTANSNLTLNSVYESRFYLVNTNDLRAINNNTTSLSSGAFYLLTPISVAASSTVNTAALALRYNS